MAGASPWRYRGAANGSYGAISVLRFDQDQELLWMGDLFGFISSFTVQQPVQEELGWHLYSSFRAFKDTCIAIEPFTSGKDALTCLASHNSIKLVKRGGFTSQRCEIKNSIQKKILTVACDGEAGSVFLGGETPGIVRFSIDAPDELVTVPSSQEVGISIMKMIVGEGGKKTIVTGCMNGDLVLRSAASLVEIGTIKSAMPGKIVALDDFQNGVFVASGAIDRTKAIVKFFDIEKHEEGAVHSVDVAGPTVSICAFDTQTPDSPEPKRLLMQLFSNGYNVVSPDATAPIYSSSGVDGACTAMAVSRNRKCCAIGSDKGFFFSLSNVHTGLEFENHTGEQVKQPVMAKFTASWSENKEGVVDQDFDDTCPEEELFSNWPPPNYILCSAEPKLRPAHPRIPVGRLEVNQWGLRRSDVYQPDPKDKLDRLIPNPYPFNMLLGEDPSDVVNVLPKLLKKYRTEMGRSKSDLGMYSKLDEANTVCFGFDFDWKSYNSSKSVVSVDNSIFESWISNIVQIIYNLQPPYYPLRKAVMRHMCHKQHCVTCELSFIFHNMLVQSQQMKEPCVPCHHLLTTLRRMESLEKCNIFVRPNSRDEAVAKLHQLQIWLLKQLEIDFKQAAKDFPSKDVDLNSFIAQTFGTEFQAAKHTIAPQFHWEVPTSATKVDEGLQHLLKQLETFNGEQVQIRRLPPILVLLMNPEHGNLKPPGSLKFTRPPKEEFNYVLAGNVIHLADDADDPGHFVTHCKVANTGEFVLINDYFVSATTTEDELEHHIPAITTHSVVVTYYVLDTFKGPKYSNNKTTVACGSIPDESGLKPLTMFDTASKLLVEDHYAAAIQQRKPVLQSPIHLIKDVEEIQPGHIVALDAEYVVLDWCNMIDPEEPEWMRRSRKNNMSLARVSCLLSKRPGDEQTIMDDFVETREDVQDYVTLYSGIFEGDLDASVSQCNLTALKATYLKLRALADRGVRFLGHGLAQDFRVMNIAVPSNQVIDTLHIFSREGQRKFSLRFLAYHILGERVQEAEHDSVEDARTALRLYRKYEQMEEDGTFEATMDYLIQVGAETGYAIPTNDKAPTPAANRSTTEKDDDEASHPPPQPAQQPVNSFEMNGSGDDLVEGTHQPVVVEEDDDDDCVNDEKPPVIVEDDSAPTSTNTSTA